MIKNILVSVSGSPDSLMAAKYAICLAKLLGARLILVYVINVKVLGELLKSRIFVEAEAQVYERDLQQQGTAFLERIGKMAESKGVSLQAHLLRGTVSDEVLRMAAQEQADLLVMGEPKEMASRADVFYDEAERIFRRAVCPVVTVRNPALVDNLYKEIV